eukprot:13469.XXX_1025986_1026102_1 [CDS] Oithona nana genome sequencing.
MIQLSQSIQLVGLICCCLQYLPHNSFLHLDLKGCLQNHQ